MTIDAPGARRSRSGVTLVESLMAAFVLTIGVVGILGMVNGLSLQSFFSTRNALAADVARRRMELLLNTDYALLSGGNERVGLFNSAWTVGGAVNRTKTVTVTVQYNGPSGRTRSVVVHSIAADPSTAGSAINFTNFPSGVLSP